MRIPYLQLTAMLGGRSLTGIAAASERIDFYQRLGAQQQNDRLDGRIGNHVSWNADMDIDLPLVLRARARFTEGTCAPHVCLSGCA